MRQEVSRELNTYNTKKIYKEMESLIEYDRTERGKLDNVMNISIGEHFSTWKLIGKEIIKSVKKSKHPIDLIDIGTGSGFWAILVANVLKDEKKNYNILAIDKVRRCINKCEKNAKKAKVQLSTSHSKYSKEVAEKSCTETIFMNPPYHIYPDEIHKRIPHHARGGSLGQEVFKKWVTASEYHLASGGNLYFHHMCLGNDHPNYVKFMKDRISGDPSIYYTNILPPIESDRFLTEVYGSIFPSFIDEVTDKFQFLFYTSGVLVRDNMGSVKRQTAESNIRNLTSWKERVKLHKNINSAFIS